MTQEIELAKSAINGGGLARTGRGLVLTTLDEMWQFAQIVMVSRTRPKAFDTVEDVFLAIQMGAEIGMSPMMALQNIVVVNGKPAPYGDATLALVYNSGQCADMDEWFELDGQRTLDLPAGLAKDWPDTFGAVCLARRVGKQNPRISKFTIGMARRANLLGKAGPWQTSPERMLKFRASGFCLRDEFPDVLKGFVSFEEVQDYPEDAKPKPAPSRAPRQEAFPVAEPVDISDAVPGVDYDKEYEWAGKDIETVYARFVQLRDEEGGKTGPCALEFKAVCAELKKLADEGKKPANPVPAKKGEPAKEEAPKVSPVQKVFENARTVTDEEAAEIERVFGDDQNDAARENDFNEKANAILADSAQIVEEIAEGEVVEPEAPKKTEKQNAKIFAVAGELWGEGDHKPKLEEMAGKRISALSKSEAASLIDRLEKELENVAKGEETVPEPVQAGAQKAPDGPSMTEAQQRAIMALAGRLYGREKRDEELAKAAKAHSETPYDLWNVGQASGFIEKLKNGIHGTS